MSDDTIERFGTEATLQPDPGGEWCRFGDAAAAVMVLEAETIWQRLVRQRRNVSLAAVRVVLTDRFRLVATLKPNPGGDWCRFDDADTAITALKHRQGDGRRMRQIDDRESEKLRQLLSDSRAERDEKSVDVARLRDSLRTAQAERDAQSTEAARLRDLFRTTQAERDRALVVNGDYKRKIEALEKRVEELTRDNGSLQDELAHYKRLDNLAAAAARQATAVTVERKKTARPRRQTATRQATQRADSKKTPARKARR